MSDPHANLGRALQVYSSVEKSHAVTRLLSTIAAGAAVALAVLTVGLVSEPGHAGADEPAIPTQSCPLQTSGHPHGYPADPPIPPSWEPAAGVDAPADAKAFASSDVNYGITYTISPRSGFWCNAFRDELENGHLRPRRITIYAAKDPIAVYNEGYNFSLPQQAIPRDVLCGWFPVLRKWQKSIGPAGTPCDSPRPVPPWEHVQFFPGKYGCCAAYGLVRIDAGHQETAAATSGHETAATVWLLYLSADMADQGVYAIGPDCAATPEFATSCRANLEQRVLTDAAGPTTTITDVNAIIAAIKADTVAPASPSPSPAPSSPATTAPVTPDLLTLSPRSGTVTTEFTVKATMPSCVRATLSAPTITFFVTKPDGTRVTLQQGPSLVFESDVPNYGDMTRTIKFKVGPDLVLAQADEVVSAVASCSTGGTSNTASLIIQQTAFTVLGDSYSAGEGNSPFTKDTDLRPTNHAATGCHRSSAGWAYKVAAARGLSNPSSPADEPTAWTFAACSGADLPDLTNANTGYVKFGEAEVAQLNAVTHATTAVAMTDGGNDVGFANILKACLVATPYVPTFRDAAGCSDPSTGIAKATETGLQKLPGDLDTAYNTILDRMAPDGVLYVAGYPHLFGSSTADDNTMVPLGQIAVTPGCKVATGFAFGYGDTQWIDTLADRGDKIITDAVARVNQEQAANGSRRRVVYADPMLDSGVDRLDSPSFAGHGLCDYNSSYINPLTFDSAHLKLPAPFQTSFHPNPGGQAAYARAFEYAMGLSVDPVGPGGATVVQGQSHTVTASGFNADEQVQATLLSAPIDLGEYTADTVGHIKVSFTVPANLQIGEHTIVLTGLTSGYTTSIPLAVAAGRPSHSKPGMPVSVWIWIGFGVLATGAVYFATTRRHRSRRAASRRV